MLRIFLLVGLLILLVPGLAPAQLIELEGRYWFADIDARAKVESGSLPGTSIDFKDDLGVDDIANAPELRLTFGLPLNNKIRLAYTYLHFEGDSTLERSINFNGSTFAANTRVDSDLKIHYGRLGWIWQPLAIPNLLKVGPMLDLKGVVLEATVESKNTGVKDRKSTRLNSSHLGISYAVFCL